MKLKLLLLLWIALLFVARVAGAQIVPYALDSIDHVTSRTVTVIGSSMATPIKCVILAGTGAKFRRIMTPTGHPILIALSSYKDSSNAQNWELDSVSAVSGDTLTISARALYGTSKFAWLNGTLVQAVASSGAQLNQLLALINTKQGALPTQSGNNGKFLQTNGTTPSWASVSSTGVSSYNGRTGAVVPVSGDYAFSNLNGVAAVAQGGLNMTTIAANKIPYGSSLGVYGQLVLGTGLSISSGTLNVGLGAFTTSTLAEGSNLYYTDARARAAISATSPVAYSSGVISMGSASAVTNGYVTATDWNTFNGKQNALTLPLSIAQGGTAGITRAAAFKNLVPDTTAKTGYFLRVDSTGDILWRPVSAGGAGSGSVTSVAQTVPAALLTISGSPITSSGTLAITATAFDSAKVWVGPVSGSATTPTSRLLVSTDIPNLPATQITSGTLAVGRGGTGQTSYTNGQLLIGNTTGNTLAKATLTQGAGMTITNGTGTITIANAGVTSAIAGTGISVSGATGDVTIANTGITAITGTANEVIVTGSGSVTLSTPQAIGTGSSPTFAGLTLSGLSDGAMLASGGVLTTGTIPNADLTNSTIGLTSSDASITVGSSPISLGGSGTVVLNMAHANTWTAAQTVNKADIRTTYTDGIVIENATASDAVHTVQQSSSAKFLGHVWNTTSTATDSVETWRLTNLPVSGTSTSSKFLFDNGNDGAGYTNVLSLTDAGVLNVVSGGSYQINSASVLNATTLGSGVVNSSLTSVGTIATGTWNATTIAVAHGGTGATTLTGVLFGNGTSAITGSHAVDLASEVTGTLPVANGGTNQTTYTNGQLLIGNTTGNTLAKATLTGTSNQVTVTNGAGSITLSLPTSVLLDKTGSNNKFGTADATSGAGNGIALLAGSGASGTDNAGGNVTILGGSATGTSGSQVRMGFASWGGASGTAANASKTYLMLGNQRNDNTYSGFRDCLQLGVSATEMGRIFMYSPTAGAVGYTGGAFIEIDTGVATGNAELTYTLPWIGSNCKFVMTEGAQTINGTKTFGTAIAAASGGTAQNSYTTGDMLYASATNVLSKRAIGSTGQILTVSGGVPTWAVASGLTGIPGGAVHGSTTGLTGGLTYYAFPNGNSTAGTTLAIAGEYPVNGNRTLQKLHCHFNAAAGVGQNTAVTVFVDGAASTLTATLSGASGVTANDDTHTVDVGADALVSVQIVPSAASGATSVAWTFDEVAR